MPEGGLPVAEMSKELTWVEAAVAVSLHGCPVGGNTLHRNLFVCTCLLLFVSRSDICVLHRATVLSNMTYDCEKKCVNSNATILTQLLWGVVLN